MSASGPLYTWGWNNYEQLGYADADSIDDGRYPNPAATDHIFVAIMMGSVHSCGLDTAGSAWCWGGGSNGQLGNGANTPAASTPIQVLGGYRFSRISAGAESSGGMLAQ